MKKKRDSNQDEDALGLIDEIALAFEGVEKHPLGGLGAARALDDVEPSPPSSGRRTVAQ